MLIGPTLGRYLSVRFAKSILAVFATVFALVFMIDFIELLRGPNSGLQCSPDGCTAPRFGPP